MTNSFKHSGNPGDLIYSLALVQYLGGGDYYLHLDQINYLSKKYYGVDAPPIHQGRMNAKDYEFMRSFMEAQTYIDRFEPMDPKTAEITHNLDRFRDLFVHHPGNYVDCYANTFNIRDANLQRLMRQTPWLTVPNARKIEGKVGVVNRTERWVSPELPPQYEVWRQEGIDRECVFVGLPHEYELFKRQTGWNIDYYPTPTMLDLAEVIAGAETFIGNQSMALSIAIGLGQEYFCELRRDLPIERNECYFPNQPNGHYI